MSPFKERVIEIIRSVPSGTVVSYGQVAAYAGLPRAAREVGWILNGTEGSQIDLPWWRVVNNEGYLSIRGTQQVDKNLQRKLLVGEGIEVAEDYLLDIKQYRFKPTSEQLKAFQLEDSYIELLITKYNL